MAVVRNGCRESLVQHRMVAAEMSEFTENIVANRIVRGDHIVEKRLKKQSFGRFAFPDQHDTLIGLPERVLVPVQARPAGIFVKQRHGRRQQVGFVVGHAVNAAGKFQER